MQKLVQNPGKGFLMVFVEVWSSKVHWIKTIKYSWLTTYTTKIRFSTLHTFGIELTTTGLNRFCKAN
jgi:hypothetical protein